jgi:diguanylate cyclase (GGDEF)-like protein/PAS domain S-box-containing protein
MTAPETSRPGPLIGDDCRMLLEFLRDAALFIDADDGAVVMWNRAAERLYGYASAELGALSIQDIVVSNEAGAGPFTDPTRRGEISDEGVMLGAIHRRADGSLLNAEVNARLAELDGREVVVAIIRDVTERLHVERQLEQAYAEMAQVLDTAADGMRIVDKDFTMLRVNRTFAQLAGVDYDEAFGMKCYDAFTGDLCHTDDCPLVRILAGEPAVDCETEKCRRDGSCVTCLLTARPYVVDGEVIGVIEDFRDITERKKAEELTAHLATHDSLTGLPNRLLFLDRLESALAWTDREPIVPAILFCDIDGFKGINDRLGHAAGDEVLIAVARALEGTVRKIDTVARIGGDEFVVLVVNAAGEADAETIAAKVVEAVAAAPVPTGVDTALGTSVGVAVFRPDESAENLMARADEAMYEAKRSGGSRYRIAE